MYSLTICFGPTGTLWAFLFKDKEKADAAFTIAAQGHNDTTMFYILDDFGQSANFMYKSIHGIVIEDIDLTDEAKILRSLANARNEVRARQRASTDPVIRTAAQQGGPSVLTPFRQN